MIQTFANLFFQFILIITFITVFFFTYVKDVEKTIVDKQVNEAIASLKNEPLLINYNFKNLNLQTPDLSSQDSSVEESNKIIEENAFKFLFILFGIGLFIIITITLVFKLSVKEMLMVTIPGLIVVGLTEFLFLNLFVKNYITLDPNMIKKGIIQGLIDYSNS